MYYPITPQTLKYPNTQYLKYSKYQKLKKKKNSDGWKPTLFGRYPQEEEGEASHSYFKSAQSLNVSSHQSLSWIIFNTAQP